ncbi:MAG TPA: carboxylating nicotinate-nucleotide diphosphorylase [Ignavibacteriales bacterium]|nr:carboxylating nicotinate-nucleotide diphosphorylase [Ignavibacteriales bacterium]HOL81020.1 carboxylating nicotinate-nucleotide diphosphorylase [Ignavibacteriales bacterium]HOM64756.1 carboxylating nicotinate-nucleotide diphosphorylase [Ignavibacteriales bacterium]HPD66712.1 carboxylating nicotinate-nucleotide diphosphorylase [Ignavibacteriales bacterium]HPP32800.1 carboxylating nicotinate-nucleotide diphosphorylase [Ignavibacteriales bacterium]
MNYSFEIKETIIRALNEDVKTGDITTEAIFTNNEIGKAKLIAKDSGILAGIEIFELTFKLVDNNIKVGTFKKDGEIIRKGDTIATLEGSISSILIAERTALNFLQRMSGIATTTNIFVDKTKHTKAKILDTRKTVPGLRLLDKMAVKIGGGENHRIGLYDMFLIKDNHIAGAGSITKAVEKVIEYKKKNNLNALIEIEVKNFDELNEAMSLPVDIIMLDNFSIANLKKAVEIVQNKFKLEASGGINMNTLVEVAETGVDYISIGALTHSVKAMDISLRIEQI